MPSAFPTAIAVALINPCIHKEDAPVDNKDILYENGGMVHCVTQQQPLD